jgi:NAD(P)-dependent dehydrogenase (short-subunit alcohol dehydrogenase family)
MKDLFEIKGKVAVVTGSSRGIGAMIARGYVQSGVKTYITARREEELRATAAELSALGECVPLVADLATLEGVKAFAAAVQARDRQVHILVNNAGTTWGAAIDGFPETGWDKVMNLNVKSLFFLTQQMLPALRAGAREDDPARVINIGSVNSFMHSGMTNYSYSASKSAVQCLTKHLGADLQADNINVNAIAPGYFPSRMTAHLLEDEAALLRQVPRGRLGSLEDAAGIAIYLAARASAYVIGQTIVVDGGMVAAS